MHHYLAQPLSNHQLHAIDNRLLQLPGMSLEAFEALLEAAVKRIDHALELHARW